MERSPTDMVNLFIENPDDPALMMHQLQALRAMVIGLAQEMTAIRQVLAKQGLMEDEAFRAGLREVMAGDHSGAGVAPWRSDSWYPLFSGNADRLRALGASEDEIARFVEECAFRENLSWDAGLSSRGIRTSQCPTNRTIKPKDVQEGAHA